MVKIRRVAIIVEDDPEVRKLVRKLLESLAFEVKEAASGRAGLALLAQVTPDLICLDLMLPELSGYQVLETVRQSALSREVPVLVISARALPEDRAHAEEVGASAYLIKPFSRAAFIAAVAGLVPAAQGGKAKP